MRQTPRWSQRRLRLSVFAAGFWLAAVTGGVAQLLVVRRIHAFMPKDLLLQAIDDAPEEQRALLERMLELKLVERFSHNDATRIWAVLYTKKGRDFIRTVRAIEATDPKRRCARLVALSLLAADKGVFGGLSIE